MEESAAPGSGDTVVTVTDFDGLLAIADAPDGHYRLGADIDMSGREWRPFAFSGTLDGGGHTLYNLTVTEVGADVCETVDGNLKPCQSRFAGLFSTAKGTEIRDLHLMGASVNLDTDGGCFAGLLAGYADQCAVENCSVDGRVKLVCHGRQVGLGGLVGYGRADFADCAADVELVMLDRLTDKRCEQFMGGLLACGTGNMTECRVTIDGWDSCHGYVHNGGLVGMYFNTGRKVRPGKVNDNAVAGQITFFEDNPDRRAYCEPYIGERLDPPAELAGNRHQFQSHESYAYATELLPETCGNPSYQEVVTPPTCDAWGSTLHECSGCGYAWRDSYTPPRHTEGDWEIVTVPGADGEGLRRCTCTVCGEVLAEERLPAVGFPHEAESVAMPWAQILVSAAVVTMLAVIAVTAVRKVYRRRHG